MHIVLEIKALEVQILSKIFCDVTVVFWEGGTMLYKEALIKHAKSLFR